MLRRLLRPAGSALALALFVTLTSASVRGQVVIEEQAQAMPSSAKLASSAWTFSEHGHFRLVLIPNQAAGGTYVEQCFFGTNHTLQAVFGGDRDGESQTVNLGAYIGEVYEYGYPGCAPYVSYGFDETVIDLGEVGPETEVTVTHFRSGANLGTNQAAVYPDDMGTRDQGWGNYYSVTRSG